MMKRILVVEPDRTNDRIMKTVLKNFSFASVINIQRARELLAKGSSFDLLVICSTVERPGDGHEFAKQVYSGNRNQKLLVLYTGQLDDQQAGIYYFDYNDWNDDTMHWAVNKIFPN